MRKLILLLVLAIVAVNLFGEANSPIERRWEFRESLEKSASPDALLLQGMKDNDPVIRRYSLYRYFIEKKENAFPALSQMVKDSDDLVMMQLIACAGNLGNQEKSDGLLKSIAENAVNPDIRRKAKKLNNFSFFRENKRLRDNPTHDHEIVTVKSILLPLEGWSFRPDPFADGHRKGWFKVDFDDIRWKKLKIGAWEEQGYSGYDGIAWYRIRFVMPEKIVSNAVELAFQAVDESAWVWLNGKYIGQHDIGPVGWDKPFWLDVTKEIVWGQENTLVVRVEDTAFAGGIWKPVSVEILK